MVKKLLLEEDEEPDYSLIAISSSTEAFQLAYEINRALGLQLKRSRTDLDIFNKGSPAYFALFQQKNEKLDQYFYLIKNRSEGDFSSGKKSSAGDLFGNFSKEERLLLPKLKGADYLLKFKSTAFTDTEILRKLKTLEQVALAYAVNEFKILLHANLKFN